MYFFGYFKDVKGYRLLQSNSIEIIVRRDVKFQEDILTCDLNLGSLPSEAYA